jgi:hypothetical protein
MPTISILGPGNREFYYQKLQKISKLDLEEEIKQITKVLVETKSTLEFLPNKGIAFDIGIEYKLQGGKKIIGTAPLSDKKVGIKHLEKYINFKLGNKKLFNKIQDGGNWAQTNQLKGLFGDAILYLGKTFGTDLELNNAAYIYKWHHKNKKFPLKMLNKNIQAGKKNPLTIIVYSKFIKSEKLEYETEQYFKKEGIKLIYAKSPQGLKKAISKLK